jgi:O-acetyl-ADP-ribose deacetylase (regulator of RNase III)
MPESVYIPIAGRTLVLLTGDITLQVADAIVNAANEQLAPGGGVCGAIHRAGGPMIWEECKAIINSQGPLPTGQAVATTAGNMKARYLIHTVGPVWRGGSDGEAEKLASCYRESIRIADQLQLKTIAFPSISTGIFGYRVDLAAPVAVRSVTDALRDSHYLEEVRFVLFDEQTFAAYANTVLQLTGKN